MKNKTVLAVIGLLIIGCAFYQAAAVVVTNFTFNFDNSTGASLTQATWNASPPVYIVSNSVAFYDNTTGQFAALVSSNFLTSYSVSSNCVFSNGPLGSLISTQIVRFNLSSNVTVLGRFKTGVVNNVGGAYVWTNSGFAVHTAP